MKQGRAKLPIKTKIAIWWLIAISVILVIFGIVVISEAEPGSDWSIMTFALFIIALVSAFLYFISAVFFAVKKRGTRIAAVVILSLITLATVISAPYGPHVGFYYLLALGTGGESNIHNMSLLVGILSTLIPLILVASDASSYWKLTGEVERSSDAPHSEPEDET